MTTYLQLLRACASTIILLALSWDVGFATKITSQALPFGYWKNASTWDIGSVPSAANCRDTLWIEEHVYLTVQQDVTGCSPIVLYISDTLRFKSGPKLKLPVGSKVVLDSGGWIVPEGTGSSSAIDVGGVEFWKATDGSVQGPINLPVELISFKYRISEQVVQLMWSTAMELNSSHFIVEKSSSGNDFEEIAVLRAAGQSNDRKNYEHSDVLSNHPDYVIYRLSQIDFDGTHYPLGEVTVRPTDARDMRIAPNPSKGIFTIETSSATPLSEIEIMDNLGRVIWRSVGDITKQKVYVVMSDMPSGYYNVVIREHEMILSSVGLMID